MARFRRLASAFWLALALLIGQQAATLHGLSHAIQGVQSGSQDQHPGTDTCLKCSAFAPFGGAAPAFVAALVVVASTAILAACSAFIPAPSRTVVTSRSRAPPSVL
jgi:hypothetical protein